MKVLKALAEMVRFIDEGQAFQNPTHLTEEEEREAARESAQTNVTFDNEGAPTFHEDKNDELS